MSDYPDQPMCPNCVTPWKCNGPHIPEGTNSAIPALVEVLGNRIAALEADAAKRAKWNEELAKANDGLEEKLRAAEQRADDLALRLEGAERWNGIYQAEIAQLKERAELLEKDAERYRKRLQWAANELLVCDYGDNPDIQQVGWIICGWKEQKKQIHEKRRIYGSSIYQAIDSEIP